MTSEEVARVVEGQKGLELNISNPKIPNLKCSKIVNFLSTNMRSQVENSILDLVIGHSQNTSTLKYCSTLPSGYVYKVYMKHR
jgi:DNA-binding cell septation regulator SpoVG